MKNFRTYDLAVSFYRHVEPLSMKSHLKEQLLRAASSIVLNLAEGNGKPSCRDQVRFFRIAMGSLRETQAILELGNVKDEISDCADKLGGSLYRLIQNAR